MNRNGHLSEKTFGPTHVQPHLASDIATKKKTFNSGKKRYGCEFGIGDAVQFPVKSRS